MKWFPQPQLLSKCQGQDDEVERPCAIEENKQETEQVQIEIS